MNTRSDHERGSLLIVAMIFSTIVAVVLTTYVLMSSNIMKISRRGYLLNTAMNLAESGAELGLSAINNNSWASPWTITGNNATATFSGFSYANGVSGTVKVFVQDK